MDNCSKHKKEVAGISDMKVLGKMITDMHYEALAELLACMSNNLAWDSINDLEDDKIKLSARLGTASDHLAYAFVEIDQAAQISKPFMEGNQKQIN